MADSSPSSGTGDDAGVRPDGESTATYPGIPSWVKVSGIIALVLVLLVVVMMTTGMLGGHGPGRHIPTGGHTPSVAFAMHQL